ncbi:MAG: DUF2059 domain-containing protein [Bdellovibrionales bacterium]
MKAYSKRRFLKLFPLLGLSIMTRTSWSAPSNDYTVDDVIKAMKFWEHTTQTITKLMTDLNKVAQTKGGLVPMTEVELKKAIRSEAERLYRSERAELAKLLTQSEINYLVTYYSSHVGQKMLAHQNKKKVIPAVDIKGYFYKKSKK